MKHFFLVGPVSVASFTFGLTLIIASLNGATLATSLGRSILSALVILLICLLIGAIVKKALTKPVTEDYSSIGPMPSSSTRDSNDQFRLGYEHLTAKKINTQVEHDLVKLLQSDPGRATELLRKMKTE